MTRRRIFRQSFLAAFTVAVSFGVALDFLGTGERGFMPHGMCYRWRSTVMWPSVISDAVIAGCYFVIPVVLFAAARTMPDLFFSKAIPYLFAAFILSCGITHVMDTLIVWWPLYYLSALAKSVCAFLSVAAVAALCRSKEDMIAFLARRGPVDA